MLTTTVLSVQGKPLFFAQDKEMFWIVLCRLGRFLAKIITVYHTVLHGLFKVPYQSTSHFCKNTYMKTLLKLEEFIIPNNLFINQQ